VGDDGKAVVAAVFVTTGGGRTADVVSRPGFVLGVGLGGFADGIVLHQLLQWHHLISSTERGELTTVAGLEANILADGIFHAATWVVTVVGVWWLWRTATSARVALARPVLGRQLLGWVLVGWGAFNVADEVVFHALLDLHHIREGEHELAYDLAFTAFGAALVLAGWRIARSRRRAVARA
jgi:uncharacterized membrane protein